MFGRLEEMLQAYADNAARGRTFNLNMASSCDPPRKQYNELVLDAAAWEASMPALVEAFFVPDSEMCAPGSTCERKVRGARAQFVAAHPERWNDTPLLRLRLNGRGGLGPFEMLE